LHLGEWNKPVPTALCAANATSFWTCEAVSEGKWQIALHGDALQSTEKAQWILAEAVSALRWDSRRGRLFAIDAAGTGILMMQIGQEKVRRFASIPSGSGRLSGLALTEDGGLWTALQSGWSVLRFAADGAQEQVIGLPVPRPQDLCVCDADSEQLFVTSAREGVPFDVLHHAPLSGRLFCIPLQKRA
jgi:sugar lactone lactonase YvrE